MKWSRSEDTRISDGEHDFEVYRGTSDELTFTVCVLDGKVHVVYAVFISDIYARHHEPQWFDAQYAWAEKLTEMVKGEPLDEAIPILETMAVLDGAIKGG